MQLSTQIQRAKSKEELARIYDEHESDFTQEDGAAFARAVFSFDIEKFAVSMLPHHLVDREGQDERPVPFCQFHKQFFQDVEDIYSDNVDEKFLINVAPRGHAKSTIGSLFTPLWAALHGKAKFIVIVSDTYSQAVLFADTIQRELESNDKIIGLYGDQKGSKWSQGDFVLTNGCKIVAKGSGQRVRGLKHGNRRPDLFILDDLENNENVQTREQRRKLEEWFVAEVMPSLSKGGVIAYHGTIIHNEALLAKVYGLKIEGIERENSYTGWIKRYYKAHSEEYDPDGTDDFAPLWPSMYNRQHWIDLKRDYQNSGLIHLYYREFLNEAISDEDREFRREYFKYFEEEDLKGRDLKVYMLVDSAPSGNKTADFNVVLVVGWDKAGNGYVLDYWRKRTATYELINKIFDYYAKYQPRRIGIQKVAFEVMLKQWIETEMRTRGIPMSIVPIKSTKTDKIVDAYKLEPFYKMGFIYHRRWMTELEEELLMFPQVRHDDLIDCLTMSLEMRKVPIKRDNAKPKARHVYSRVAY